MPSRTRASISVSVERTRDVSVVDAQTGGAAMQARTALRTIPAIRTLPRLLWGTTLVYTM